MEEVNATDVRRERIPLLWSTAENNNNNNQKQRWPKVLVLTWGIRNIRVSAAERSCVERDHAVTRSERQQVDDSGKKL